MTDSRLPDEHSRFEDEGIPDLQEGTPGQQWAEDPQELPLPGDDPTAVDDFGTTIDEQIRGESLDDRLAREVPETVVDPLEPRDPDEPVDGVAGDGDYRVGRLVEEDEGAHTDTEKDSVATDVGADMGGQTAEEAAMHLEPDDRVGEPASGRPAGLGRACRQSSAAGHLGGGEALPAAVHEAWTGVRHVETRVRRGV